MDSAKREFLGIIVHAVLNNVRGTDKTWVDLSDSEKLECETVGERLYIEGLLGAARASRETADFALCEWRARRADTAARERK